MLTGNVEPIFARHIPDKIDITRAPPWPLEIDRAEHFSVGIAMLNLEGHALACPTFKRRRRGALQFFCDMTDEFLEQVRHFFEISVGPVNFQHRKFRIVLPRNAFVPEIPVQFEDFGESANQKALQIKFGSDPQIKIEPERLVVGAERRRRRATGHRLQNRRFHFQETAVFQKPADLAHHRDPFLKRFP